MGIIGKMRVATPKQISALIRDPEQTDDFLRHGCLEEEDEGDDVFIDDPANTLDLDKSWHGLHFLFTGQSQGGSPPLNFILAGGTPLGTRDVGGGVGYGPARAFSPEQVKEIAERLKGLTEGELHQRFDPAELRMQHVYPDDIWTRSDEETIGYLLEYFDVLRHFVLKAAAEGKGILVYKD